MAMMIIQGWIDMLKLLHPTDNKQQVLNLGIADWSWSRTSHVTALIILIMATVLVAWQRKERKRKKTALSNTSTRRRKATRTSASRKKTFTRDAPVPVAVVAAPAPPEREEDDLLQDGISSNHNHNHDHHHHPVDEVDSLSDGETSSTLTLRTHVGISSEGDEDEDDEEEEESPSALSVQSSVPHSTNEERQRFLIAKQGNVKQAIRSLQEYLDWVEEHRVIRQQVLQDMNLSTKDYEDHNTSQTRRRPRPQQLTDAQQWAIAAATAMRARGEKEPNLKLPQIASIHTLEDNGEHVIRDKSGYRILHVTPGRMDDKLANLQTYGLAMALYIDATLPRDSLARLTICMDARGGKGWRNMNAPQLLPFLRHMTGLLLGMFPERLSRVVVYPVPDAFRWIWMLVSRWFDAMTAERVALVTGQATIDSPIPKQGMMEFMDEAVVDCIEQKRIQAFVVDEEEEEEDAGVAAQDEKDESPQQQQQQQDENENKDKDSSTDPQKDKQDEIARQNDVVDPPKEQDATRVSHQETTTSATSKTQSPSQKQQQQGDDIPWFRFWEKLQQGQNKEQDASVVDKEQNTTGEPPKEKDEDATRASHQETTTTTTTNATSKTQPPPQQKPDDVPWFRIWEKLRPPQASTSKSSS